MAAGKSRTRDRNIYWRNGTAWARIQIAGRDVRRSLFTSDRAEARRRLAAILKDAERVRFGEGPRHTYREAVLAWAKTGFGGVKASSAERYKTSLRMLDPHFGGLYLDQITKKEVGRYVLERKAKASNATIRRDLSALSGLLATAEAMDLCDENAARIFDRKVIKAPKKPFVRPDQRAFDFLVSRAPGTFGALLRFLLATGMRENEATVLPRRGRIDPLTGQLTIDGKRGVRTITISPAALAVAAETPAHIGSPFLFWTPAGGRYSTAWSVQARLCRSAQKAARAEGWEFRRFKIHDLRHEYAIRWLENGGRLYALQRHLGHSSVGQTEDYLAYVAPEVAEKIRAEA